MQVSQLYLVLSLLDFPLSLHLNQPIVDSLKDISRLVSLEKRVLNLIKSLSMLFNGSSGAEE